MAGATGNQEAALPQDRQHEGLEPQAVETTAGATVRKHLGTLLTRLGLFLYRLGSRIRGRRRTQIEAISSHPAYRGRHRPVQPVPG